MNRCPVKQKIAQRFGKLPTLSALAQLAGTFPANVCRVISCTGDDSCAARHTAEVQDRLASALNMSTSGLFGDHAWFRLAARRLEQKVKQRGVA